MGLGVKKLTKEEIEAKRRILGSFAIDSFGEDIYQLPGGALTGKGGVEIYEKAVENLLKKELKKK